MPSKPSADRRAVPGPSDDADRLIRELESQLRRCLLGQTANVDVSEAARHWGERAAPLLSEHKRAVREVVTAVAAVDLSNQAARTTTVAHAMRLLARLRSLASGERPREAVVPGASPAAHAANPLPSPPSPSAETRVTFSHSSAADRPPVASQPGSKPATPYADFGRQTDRMRPPNGSRAQDAATARNTPPKPPATPTRSRSATVKPHGPPEKEPRRRGAPPATRAVSINDLTLDSPVQAIRLYNRRYAAALDKLGIVTVGDLLRHYPRRYDDFSHLLPIAQLRPGMEVTIEATIVRCEAVGLYGRRGRRVEAVLGDDTGTIRAVWFNQEWLAKQLTTGLRLYVSGRVDVFNGRLQFTAPSTERVGDAEAVHTGRLVPVYPLAGNLSQNWLRARLKWVVDEVAHRIDDPLPDELRRRWHLPALHEAMQQVHFPDDEQGRDAARNRLAFDDLLLLQLGMLRHKREWQQGGTAVPLLLPDDRLAALAERLPFRLTGDQIRATREILSDAAADRPMSRLLQGDVGSGKTVVAALAMLAAVEHGCQAALMAPTEILAEQHARTLGTLFDTMHPLLQPVLITGSMSEAARARAWGQVASGQKAIVVGTHALIQERGEFSRLALVVIDEQHRFGVMQRAALRKKGDAPHLLAMTATPIPRTLALTLHGDLDVSTIAELPAGRQEIKTRYASPDKREAAYAFVRRQIAEGRQAFVICPLVEESDVVEAKAATVEYERLRQSVFPDLRLELVHGQMKAQDKDAAMRRFRDGQADILVATTVVEVGVDVPNATVMLIENAERFGLAQLHQLRGRVGRGAHQSYCILMASPDVNDAAIERLQVVQSTTDGFRLAEEDLRLRGPGSFLGVEQSGLQPLLAMADVSVLEQARQAAAELLDEDPDLTAPEHRALADRLAGLWERLRQAAEWH